MNQATIKEIIKIFLLISIPFIVVKSLYLTSFFYLEQKGVDYKVKNDDNFYEKFKFAQAFNLETAKDAPKVTPTPEAKEVYQLTDNIKLKATYLNENSSFIAVENQQNKIEFVDLNSTFNGYKLIGIELYKAIFEKDGKNYELLLIDEKTLPKAEEREILESNIYNVKKDVVQKFATDFDEIWKHITIEEIKENDVILGFKVIHIKPDSIFNQIGLKPNDIIKAVNNVELKSYADAFNVYKKINELDSLKITFIRDNEEKEIEYEIN